MSKYTKGPWKAVKDSPLTYAIVIYSSDYDVVAVLDTDNPNDKANAQLVAAAPDLLEACEKALHVIDDLSQDILTEDNEFLSEIIDIKEAIKKAKGI